MIACFSNIFLKKGHIFLVHIYLNLKNKVCKFKTNPYINAQVLQSELKTASATSRLRDFLARDFRETETTRLPTRLRDQKINLCHGTVAMVSLAPLYYTLDDVL